MDNKSYFSIFRLNGNTQHIHPGSGLNVQMQVKAAFDISHYSPKQKNPKENSYSYEIIEEITLLKP